MASSVPKEKTDTNTGQTRSCAGSVSGGLSRRESKVEAENEFADITIHSRTRGVLKGHSVDISESGIAAMMRIEVPLGEVVELDFTLPFGPVTTSAMVRQRRAFRYGFQFIELRDLEVFRRTCRQLAVEHALISPESSVTKVARKFLRKSCCGDRSRRLLAEKHHPGGTGPPEPPVNRRPSSLLCLS